MNPQKTASSQVDLQSLLNSRHLWRGQYQAAAGRGMRASGFAEFDQATGGWPKAALTEVLVDEYGIGELSVLMPALVSMSQGDRWIAWIDPPFLPYAPALQEAGVDVSRILLIQSKSGFDALWSLEQALRSGNCAAAFGWLGQVEEQRIRRLQLAAEEGDAWGVLFRPTSAARQPSPAALRLTLESRLDARQGGCRQLGMHVLKQRGPIKAPRFQMGLPF